MNFFSNKQQLITRQNNRAGNQANLLMLGALSLVFILLGIGDAHSTTVSNARQSQSVNSLGAKASKKLATRMARQHRLSVLDAQSCAGGDDSCIKVAVQNRDGQAMAYKLSSKPCKKQKQTCLGGYTILDRYGANKRKPKSDRPSGTNAKISANPGDDGLTDPEEEAQANANNEIIESLADGNYNNDYEQFWQDLESIHSWTNPSWIEPDAKIPTIDKVWFTGPNTKNPAVLVSGRYKDTDGHKDCGSWVSGTSTTSTVKTDRNWISNAITDSCDSELAVFAEDGAAQLIKPVGDWSKGSDRIDIALDAPIKVPTSVWVIKAPRGFANEEQDLLDEYELGNDILRTSRCGIELDVTANNIHDRTTSLADPDQELGCASIETVFKQIGFHENRMNVYIVEALIADNRAGVACTAESDNVIVLDRGRSRTALIHEYGHWFDLWHTNSDDMPLVNQNNVMSVEGDDSLFTAGQCYRANFSKDSYINEQGLRNGRTKECRHLQDADSKCPGVKNEF